jgi:putative oxidoreductase
MKSIYPSNWRQSHIGLIFLRVVISIIIFSHGFHRFTFDGSEPFGQWLTEQGFPAGFYLAWTVTLFELAGAVLLALGIKKLPICLAFIGVYSVGLVMVHLPHGWFVVGSGSNGIEYSVLIIASLICIAWPQKSNNSWSSQR